MLAIVVGVALYLRKGMAAPQTKDTTKDFFGPKSGNHIVGAFSLVIGIFVLVYVSIAAYTYDPDAPKAQSYSPGITQTKVDNTGHLHKVEFSTGDLTDQSFLAYGGLIVGCGAALYGLVNIARFVSKNPQSRNLRWWLPFDFSRLGSLTSKPFYQKVVTGLSSGNFAQKIKHNLIPIGAVVGVGLFMAVPKCAKHPTGELNRKAATEMLNKHLAKPHISRLSFSKEGFERAGQDGITTVILPHLIFDNNPNHRFTNAGLGMMQGLATADTKIYYAAILGRTFNLDANISERVTGVNGIQLIDQNRCSVEFVSEYVIPTEMKPMMKYLYSGHQYTAFFQKYDDGWRVSDVSE